MDDIKDSVDIRFSSEATEIAETIKERFFFSQSISVFKFAAAYALREYAEEMDFSKLDYQYDKAGNNYHYGSFDVGSSFSKLIRTMYPWCTTPTKYARVAACFGLLKIKEMMDADPDFNIVNLVHNNSHR